VLFGTATSTFTVNSDTQITVVSPAGTGMVHVTVITRKGTSATSSADQFTYQGTLPPPPIPAIASISPTSGLTTGGTTVTITGAGFIEVSKVLFGATAANFTVNTDKQITAVSPAHTAGWVDVTVTTPGGTSNAARFNYYVPVPPPVHIPTVASISPNTGPVAGGTRVTITGQFFTGASKVQFGTTAASFTVNTDKQITAVSPAHTAGWVDVTVTTPGGTSKTSSADRFTYIPRLGPVVSSIVPTSGPEAGGTTVIIQGSGFTDATGVSFGSTAAASFTVDSDSQITAVSPAGRGTVDVTVTTPGGTSATNSADKFTYIPPPVISSIQPKSGSPTGGDDIIIQGSGFTGATQVSFGSTAAASFTVNSDSQITAVSPAGSENSTVDVTVTTLGGTSATSSNDEFYYTIG